jgi:hypothetical protein
MKHFFSSSVLALSITLLFVLAPDRSLTATSPEIGPVKSPITVLAVQLNATEPQTNDRSAQHATSLEGLEVEIENTSGKPIQYLVVHAEIPIGPGETVKLPMVYGQPFPSDAKTDKTESLQPGSKLILRAAKNICERARKQLAAKSVALTEKQVHPNVHLVLFQDRTSWMAGRLHVPDPANAKHWIAVEELARTQSPVSELGFSKASYKPAGTSQQQCYRYTGFDIIFCCSDDTGPYLAGTAEFAPDPNGHVHPNNVTICCPQDPTACCAIDEIAGGCL